jgi:hypothetical protein
MILSKETGDYSNPEDHVAFGHVRHVHGEHARR